VVGRLGPMASRRGTDLIIRNPKGAVVYQLGTSGVTPLSVVLTDLSTVPRFVGDDRIMFEHGNRSTELIDASSGTSIGSVVGHLSPSQDGSVVVRYGEDPLNPSPAALLRATALHPRGRIPGRNLPESSLSPPTLTGP